MRILHIVRAFEDVRALTMAAAQTVDHDVSLLLLHEAAGEAPRFPGAVYTCREDVERLGLQPGTGALDYGQMVDELAAQDRVVCW